MKHTSRREFLVFVGLGWFPFFRRRTARLAEAEFRILRRGGGARRYLHIHGDETTARQALEEHMRAASGTALMVRGQTRTVPLRGGTIDPNRAFSRAGAEASLRRLNPAWDPPRLAAVLDALDRARPAFLRALLPPPGGLLIALHNNARGYSIHSEIPISDRVSLGQPENPHAFFLATDPADYDLLARSPYNVVLQQKAPAGDDGSLSRLAAKLGVRYVNLEVALGELDRQREMLRFLDRTLP